MPFCNITYLWNDPRIRSHWFEFKTNVLHAFAWATVGEFMPNCSAAW